MAMHRVMNNWKVYFRNIQSQLKAFGAEVLTLGCAKVYPVNGVELN